MLVVGTAAKPDAEARWRPALKVTGAVDVVGPRKDGRLVIASTQGLFLYRRGGALTPFARGPQGFVPPIGETYIALGRDRRLSAAGCRFRRDEVYVLDPAANPGVIKVDRQGHAQRLVSFPGYFLSGITFDHIGRSRVILQDGQKVEGGIAVAPASFGRFGGQLIAPDEFGGGIYAFDSRGRTALVARSGLPGGADLGVEGVGFIPSGFTRRGTAYFSDRASPGSPTPGTDAILTLPGVKLQRARVRAGDLLVATEAGAVTLAIRCVRRCTVRRIGSGPGATHGEGHVTVVQGS